MNKRSRYGNRGAYSYYKNKLENLSLKEENRLIKVEKLAYELMAIHGVNFKFRFSYSRKALGSCSETTISIRLSFALHGKMDLIKNTILHEIAHAILGPRKGHRIEWQNKARELGVTWTRNYRK